MCVVVAQIISIFTGSFKLFYGGFSFLYIYMFAKLKEL